MSGSTPRASKVCSECNQEFVPTGPNTKRCPECRRPYELARLKERWHRNYEKKGYDQKGEKNNAWAGGISTAYYRGLALSHYGSRCEVCQTEDVASNLVVHHRNRDRRDNRVENLEVMHKRCHQLEHSCADNLPEVVVFKERSCDRCKKTFVPTGPRASRCEACCAQFGPGPSYFKPRKCKACKQEFQPTASPTEQCPDCVNGRRTREDAGQSPHAYVDDFGDEEWEYLDFPYPQDLIEEGKHQLAFPDPVALPTPRIRPPAFWPEQT